MLCWGLLTVVSNFSTPDFLDEVPLPDPLDILLTVSFLSNLIIKIEPEEAQKIDVFQNQIVSEFPLKIF